MKRIKHYVVPPRVTLEGYSYTPGRIREMCYYTEPPHYEQQGGDSADTGGPEVSKYRSYTEYNYGRNKILTYVKTQHFEEALRLTANYFYKANVIDFGCADGPFLPSLVRYFKRVVGIDRNPDFIKLCSKLVNTANLTNVDLICNTDLTIADLRARLANETYHVLFLLEVLEHIGRKEALYSSKIDFINELFSLLSEEGIIVISAPNMVGISFAIQRLGLLLTKSHHDPMSLTDFIRAVVLKNVSRLEHKWDHGHLGFNHLKLESLLKDEFWVKRQPGFFHVLYLVRKHRAANGLRA